MSKNQDFKVLSGVNLTHVKYGIKRVMMKDVPSSVAYNLLKILRVTGLNDLEILSFEDKVFDAEQYLSYIEEIVRQLETCSISDVFEEFNIELVPIRGYTPAIQEMQSDARRLLNSKGYSEAFLDDSEVTGIVNKIKECPEKETEILDFLCDK